jgi:hypothetical protein
VSRRGETGIRARLKISWPQGRGGSTPLAGTNPFECLESKKQPVLISVSVPAKPLAVSLKDTAKLIGLKPYSVRRLARRGDLLYRVVGNKWLINFASLEAFAACKGTRSAVRPALLSLVALDSDNSAHFPWA